MKLNYETEVLSLKRKGLTDEKVIKDLIKFKEQNPHLLKKTYVELYVAFKGDLS